MDSALFPVEPLDRSKVGRKLNAATASAAMTMPETAANRTGRLAIARPIAAKRAPRGSVFQAFDGQKTRVPSSDTNEGIRVRPATSVTATAIASAGPSERNRPSVDSASAMNDTITAPPADTIASPARVTAPATAAFGLSPARRRSR